MSNLPSGTVTFLLTDIEGSTALWEQHGEAMGTAVARHDAVLGAAVVEHGGAVIKSRGEGDSVFAVFARASDALAAAIAAQRALTAAAGNREPGAGDSENSSAAGCRLPAALRVRMALHTGEAEERDGDYFGGAVNRCARLRAIAHGGQILLSHATYDLVRDQTPADVMLHDLGEHRLRDLVRPEHLFQVVTVGLPAEFPPLRTLDVHTHNLPVQPTVLIGRERELEAVGRLLLQPETHLLTLTGPGGTGKTRLSLQVAAELLEDFAEGVYFVPLAPISDPSLVATTIAQTLGVREREGNSPQEALTAHLRDKAMLLVLDNFEQVVDAASVVAGLLVACPRLKVLVTSRAVLHLRGEREYPVPPLGLPSPGRLPSAAALSQYAAVQLFIQRALDVRPDFAVTNENAPAVAEICVRLDGLPLAIELAAARIRLLPPQAMLARMERRLPLLVGGARDLPARQQTLRGAIAWSHDLLGAEEQLLFRRLAVFSGGCTLEDAEAVCNSGGDLDLLGGMESLLAQSLLRQEEMDGDARFSMLETIREFAVERLLESGEADEVQSRHAAVYLALAEQAQPQINGPQQSVWLARLEGEHDNLRAALRWLEMRGDVDRAVRLIEALWRFWHLRAHVTEGREQAKRIAAAVEITGHAAYVLRMLNVEGSLAIHHNDFVTARAIFERYLAMLRSAGDVAGLRYVLISLGTVAAKQGDHHAAGAYIEESIEIARQEGDTFGAAQSLNDLANLAHERGEYDEARALFQECLDLAREMGSTFLVASVLNNIAVVAQDQSDFAAARAWFEESLATRRAMRDQRGVALSLLNLANLLMDQREYGNARARLTEGLRIQQELGSTGGIALVLERFACLGAAQGQAERALRLAGAAAALRDAVGANLTANARLMLDRRLSPALLTLGEAASAAASAAGRAMSLDEAVTYALAE